MTYEHPMAVEAYAYLHLLERYRRFWSVLLELTRIGRLPLARTMVRLLDVGAGPAPASFAASDFYRELRAYSLADQNAKLAPTIVPETAESNAHMVRWTHHFAELARFPGPFQAAWLDATTIDPIERGRSKRAAQIRVLAEELDTTEQFATWWLSKEEGPPDERLRLVIFSNFLTQKEMVDAMEHRLRAIRQWLFPGGTVIVLGGAGGHYPKLYDRLDLLMTEAGLGRVTGLPEELISLRADHTARSIAAFQASVWTILSRCADTGALPENLISNLSNRQGFRTDRRFGVRAYRTKDFRARSWTHSRS